jgi:hypothetical protein
MGAKERLKTTFSSKKIVVPLTSISTVIENLGTPGPKNDGVGGALFCYVLMLNHVVVCLWSTAVTICGVGVQMFSRSRLDAAAVWDTQQSSFCQMTKPLSSAEVLKGFSLQLSLLGRCCLSAAIPAHLGAAHSAGPL